MSSIPWLCVFLAFFGQTFAQQCWYPDGETPSPDIPCDTNGHTSACCGADNFCLNNGLCFGPVLSRGSCTDRSWGKGCPQYCATGQFHSSCSLSLGVKLCGHGILACEALSRASKSIALGLGAQTCSDSSLICISRLWLKRWLRSNDLRWQPPPVHLWKFIRL